ncbi:MAG: TonB-dependent receptor [Bacteroidales bacterium]|nr:TonB-dependent receptor [Bacteroidales bacterium]
MRRENITRVITSLLLAFSFIGSTAQTRHTLSGHIYDSTTGEAIPYATCWNENNSQGTTTNAFGYFSIQNEGHTKLRVSCIGYKTVAIDVASNNDTTIVIKLAPKSTNLQEVVVSTYIPMQEQVQMGKNTVPTALIKQMPSFAGEPDILKSITYLPGVISGKDGYSNIFVRGGDRGQNLVLLDGIKIYNTSHAGGFLSLFNSDIVKHVDVYKGGFPAQYGGRASSIVDIVTKDGNNERFCGKASIGLISSNILIESPIGSNLSFYLAGRTSYFALFSAKQRKDFKKTGTGEYWNYSFFDINSRIKWRINPNSNLSLSIFYGDDILSSADGDRNKDGEHQLRKDRLLINNKGISLTHTQSFKSVFWRNIVSLSQYKNDNIYHFEEMYSDTILTRTKTISSIRDLSAQSRIEISSGIGQIKTGVEFSHYYFRPSLTQSTDIRSISDIMNDTIVGDLTPMRSYETSAYVNDAIEITDRLSSEVGLRSTYYTAKGAQYWRTEPRISARYMFSDNISLKANYTMMNQYNHVILSMREGIEKEMWTASTRNLKPQHANQVSAGLFYGREENKLNVSAEAFYKKMTNLITYRAPVDEYDATASIETAVETGGTGRCHGIETMISKEWEAVSASLSYTLSRNERRFRYINKGQWYPFHYDRRHDLNILATWHINSKWSLSGNFALSSGAPVTLPVSYVSDGLINEDYYVYEGINNRRLPTYHRLDLAATRSKRTRRGNMSEFKINIFNVYARQNAQAMYFNSWNNKATQISMFSIVPTVSYSITF